MPNKNPLNPRVLPGVIVAIAGIVLLLNSFEILDLGGLRRFWPLLLVALGAHLAFEGGNKTFGAIVATVGAALQLDNLGLLDINIREVMKFWPLVLVGLGVKMLLRPTGKDNSVMGIILLTLGGYFQARNLDLIHFGIAQLWPVAIIAAGIGMLRKSMGRA